MKLTQINQLNEELRRLDYIAGVFGTALVKKNGLLVTSRLPRDIDDRKFGAMAATMFSALETAIKSTDDPYINHITLELDDLQVIVMNGGKKTLLISVLEIDTNLGIILMELEQIINKIKSILINR